MKIAYDPLATTLSVTFESDPPATLNFPSVPQGVATQFQQAPSQIDYYLSEIAPKFERQVAHPRG